MVDGENHLIRNIIEELQQSDQLRHALIAKFSRVSPPGKLEQLVRLISGVAGPPPATNQEFRGYFLYEQLESISALGKGIEQELIDAADILCTQPGVYSFSSVSFWPIYAPGGLFHFTGLHNLDGQRIRNEELWPAFTLGIRSTTNQLIETRFPRLPSVYVPEGKILPVQMYKTEGERKGHKSRTVYLEPTTRVDILINYRDVANI